MRPWRGAVWPSVGETTDNPWHPSFSEVPPHPHPYLFGPTPPSCQRRGAHVAEVTPDAWSAPQHNVLPLRAMHLPAPALQVQAGVPPADVTRPAREVGRCDRAPDRLVHAGASAITAAPPIARMAVPFSIRSRKDPVTERISECVEFLLQFPALRFSPIVEILQAMLNFLGFEDLAVIKNIARRATD